LISYLSEKEEAKEKVLCWPICRKSLFFSSARTCWITLNT